MEPLSHGTSLVELTALAAKARDAIAECEKTATPHYWRLGQILMLARKHVARGSWADFLAMLRIEKTRASKARAIFRAFGTAEQTADLSVADAYEQRVRSPHGQQRRQSVPEARSEVPTPAVTLPRWIFTVAQDAVRLRDEIEFLNAEEIETVLSATQQAIALLTELHTAAGRHASLS
jgi:hypothetical protein